MSRDARKGWVFLLIALVLGAIIGAGIFALTDDDNAQQAQKPTPSVTATPAPTLAPPAGDLQAPKPDAGEPVTEAPKDSELRDETPPEVDPQTLKDGADKTNKLAEPLPDKPQPVGGAQGFSCRRDFSGQVYSSRNGVKPTEWINHYTVSSNVTGWGDVLAIQAFFKRTREASVHFILDFEGHCLQMVPLSEKAWTEGAANPWGLSVEIIATGGESRSQWLNAPIFKRHILAALARDTMKRYGLPHKRVNPVGCVFPPGWTDHNALECGNAHTDVMPNFPYDVFQRQLDEGPVVIGFAGLTKGEQATVKNLRAQRKKGRHPNKPKTGKWDGHPLALKQAKKDIAKLKAGLAFYAKHKTAQRRARASYIRKVLAS